MAWKLIARLILTLKVINMVSFRFPVSYFWSHFAISSCITWLKRYTYYLVYERFSNTVPVLCFHNFLLETVWLSLSMWFLCLILVSGFVYCINYVQSMKTSVADTTIQNMDSKIVVWVDLIDIAALSSFILSWPDICLILTLWSMNSNCSWVWVLDLCTALKIMQLHSEWKQTSFWSMFAVSSDFRIELEIRVLFRTELKYNLWRCSLFFV